MGRHTVPGSGASEPDRGFWVRVVMAAIAVLLVLGFVATRLLVGGGDASTTDAAPPSTSATATASPTLSASPTSSPTSSRTSSPSRSTRPPTLSFRVLSRTYLTIRIPGGRTLDSKFFPAGATATYDQKVLKVVNRRPAGVRFLVNGAPHKPGPRAKPETFTARRG